MSRLLGLSRVCRVNAALPQFTKNRYVRRPNMMDEDRIKWYNMNLICIAITFVPIMYLKTVNFHTSPDTEVILKTLDATGDASITYTKSVYN